MLTDLKEEEKATKIILVESRLTRTHDKSMSLNKGVLSSQTEALPLMYLKTG